MHWNSEWHMGWWMGLWWIVIVAAVVAVLWLALSSARRGGAAPQESPEQILKRRYAKGEIDRETYEKMLETLRK